MKQAISHIITTCNRRVRSCRDSARLLVMVILIHCCAVLPALGAGGDLLWQAGQALEGKQEAQAMVVDKAGNVIVTGYRNLTGGSDDYWTVKFKADGTGVAWFAPFNKSNGRDQALAIAVDANNDVIVTGHVWNGLNKDVCTIKYDGTTGTELWKHTYNAPNDGNDAGSSIAIDKNSGDVYVGGYTQNADGNTDFLLLKYTAAGPNTTQVWAKTYGGNGEDEVAAIAVGSTAVAVTGRYWNGSDFDIATVAYTFSGTESWSKILPSPGDDRGLLVRINNAGDVIVAGYAAGNGSDIYVAKFAAGSGDPLWPQPFRYDGGSIDLPTGLVLDDLGDVYLTGTTWTANAYNDLYTARINGFNGALRWQKTYNSSNGNDDMGVANGIAVDNQGDVFVTGATLVAGDYDIQVVKYKKETGASQEGIELWRATYTGAEGKSALPVGIGLTGDGKVLVAGWQDTTATGLDYLVLQYDPDLLNPPTNLRATYTPGRVDLAWDNNSTGVENFVIQRCSGWGCSSNEASFQDLSPMAGANETTYTDLSTTADSYYYYRVKAIGDGKISHASDPPVRVLTVYVTYNSSPTSLTVDGANHLDDYATAIACGPDNAPVVTGYSDNQDGGGNDYYTFKLDSSLQTIWSKSYNSLQEGTDEANCLTVDSNGDVVVSGDSELFYQPSGSPTGAVVNSVYTLKYHYLSGLEPAKVWGDQFNGPAGIDDRSTAVASSADASNNIAVVGHGKNSQGNEDLYLIMYRPDGSRAWNPVIIDRGGDDIPTAVAFDRNGDIFLTGYSKSAANFDIYTAKYSGSTGAQLWLDIYDGGKGDDKAFSLAVDPAGNPYVTGFTIASELNRTDRDFITIKYDGADSSAQRQLWVRTSNGLANGDDEAKSIAIDPIDGTTIAIAGTVMTHSGDSDFRIVRYDSTGLQLQEKTLQRPDSSDEVTAMGMDLMGNLVVAGTTYSNGKASAMAIKWRSDGSIIGGTTVTPAGSNAEVSSIAMNRRGEGYIAGYAENSDGFADYLVFMIAAEPLQPPYPLTSANPTPTGVTLNWGDNATSEDGFHVWRKEGTCASASPFSLVATKLPDQTSHLDTGLTPATGYCYKVTAYSGTTDTKGAEVGILTLPAAPTLSLVADSAVQITLSWTNVAGETGYEVERREWPSGTWSKIADKGVDQTSYANSGLSSTIVYAYRVAVVNAIGKNYSNEAWLPTTPVMAAPVVASPFQINLTWSNTSGADSFCLDRKVASGSFAQLTCNIYSPSYSDTGLLSGTLYTYRVRGNNIWGNSVYSNEGSVTTKLQPPIILTATTNSTTQITVTWSDTNNPPNGNESNYQVSYSLCTNTSPDACTDPNQSYWGGWTTFPASAANSTSAPISGLSSGRTYRFRVQGLLSGANSDYSVMLVATTKMDKPAAPTASNIKNTEITLTWGALNGEASWDIIKNDVPMNLNLPKDTTSKVIDLLTPNTSYCFQVKACNTIECVTSDKTSPCPSTTLDPPILSEVTPLSQTSIRISWGSASGAEIYKLERTTLVNQQDDPAAPASGWSTTWTTVYSGANLTYTDTPSASNKGYSYKYRISYKPVGSTVYSSYSEGYTTTWPDTPALSAANGSLNWTNVTGETGFKLWEKLHNDTNCSDETFDGVTPATYTRNTTTMTPTIASGTVKCYKVSAYNLGESPASGAFLFLAPPVISPPTNITQGSMKVCWSEVAGSSGYSLDRSTSSSFSSPTTKTLTAGQLCDDITSGLNAGTTYYFRVKTLWGTNSSGYSTTSAPTIPSTPAGLTATGQSTTQIYAIWSSTTGATSYNLQYKKASVATDCSTTGFWDSGVTTKTTASYYYYINFTSPDLPGDAYCIRVNAANGSGGSGYSASVYEGTLLPAPAKPTLDATTYGKVNVSWGRVTGNNGYKLERYYTSPYFTGWSAIGSTAKDVETYSDTVTPGDTLRYRVSAMNLVGDYSAVSPENSIVAKPAAPATLTATVVNHNRIDLSWSASTGATLYRLERKTGNGSWGLVLEQAGTTYQNTGLSAATDYTYRVQAWNTSGGYSPYSSEAPARTLSLGPVAMVSTTADSPTQVTVKWNYSGNSCTPTCTLPDGYELEVKIWNGRWVRIATFQSGDIYTFTDTNGPRPGKTYSYRVRAYRGNELSEYSDEMSVTMPPYLPGSGDCSYGIGVDLNHPPVITSSPTTTSATQGVPYAYQVTVSDPYAGDTFYYTLPSSPQGMTVSAAGLVSWTPSYTKSGFQNVTIRVSDVQGSIAEQSYTINVAGVNQQPTVTSNPITSTNVNQLYSYQVVAVDQNADPLQYSLAAGPSGMTISSTGLISWTPSTTGDYPVSVSVTDGELTALQNFTLSVIPALPIPILTPEPDYADCNGSVYVTLDWNPVSAPSGHSVEYQVEKNGVLQSWSTAISFSYWEWGTANWRVRARDTVTLLTSDWSGMDTFTYNYVCE